MEKKICVNIDKKTKKTEHARKSGFGHKPHQAKIKL